MSTHDHTAAATLVSVIMPVYNTGRRLLESVQSAQEQTHPCVEIILVDDGSSDPETLDALKTCSARGFSVIRKDNGGVSSAMNTGLASAKGRYFTVLGDDLISPSYLAEAVEALDTDPQLGIVYCNAQLFGSVNEPWTLPPFSMKTELIDNCIFATAVFRTADWRAVGGYDEAMRMGLEDHDFILRILGLGRGVKKLEGTYFHYRRGIQGSISEQVGSNRAKEIAAHVAMMRNNSQLYLDNAELFWESYFELVDQVTYLKQRYAPLEEAACDATRARNHSFGEVRAWSSCQGPACTRLTDSCERRMNRHTHIGTRLLLVCDGAPFTGTNGAAALPFGAEKLRDAGFTIVNPHRAHTQGMFTKLRDVIEHRTGTLVEDGLRGTGTRADVVLAMFENNAWFPLRLRLLKVPPYAGALMVVVICWAAEEMRHQGPEPRRRTAARLNRADLLFVLSENQIELLAGFGVDHSKLHAIPFGIEAEFFAQTTSTPRDGIIAVGQDRGRDYSTLAAAVAGTGLEVSVYSRPENLRGLALPPEIRPMGTVPKTAYSDALRTAVAVVVPTHDLAYPTGQTVALEAAAAGALVVTTGTEAMEEYFTHQETALLSPPGDAQSLRDNLLRVGHDPTLGAIAQAGHDMVHRRFTTSTMWSAIERVLTPALTGTGRAK